MNIRGFVLTLVVFAIFSAGVMAFFNFTSVFTFQETTCTINAGTCPDYVTAELSTYRGKSLFFTDLQPLEDTIRKNTPTLNEVHIKKSLPHNLSVVISTAGPRYVFVDSSNTPWVIDVHGFVVDVAADELLPRLGIAPSFQFYVTKGDKLPDELHQQLLVTFPELTRSPLLGSRFFLLSEREGELQLSSGEKAFFRLSVDLLDIKKLQYILEHKEENTFKERVTEIDLRYGQVIVRTASSSAEVAPKN